MNVTANFLAATGIKTEDLTIKPDDQTSVLDSPISGDSTFYTYFVPGAVFQAKDGSSWHVESITDQGFVRIRNVWYPRQEATVPTASVRRSIDSWISPIQQKVDPLPEGTPWFGIHNVSPYADNSNNSKKA